MPSILNSDDGVVSGTSGLKSTGGNDGITAFQQNGTERMRIDSSGNVGIGTSSPVNYSTYKGLTVADTTGGFVHLRNTANSHQAELGLNGGTGAAYLATYTSTPIQFLTNNTERMRIDSSGNVNIGSGTQNPASVTFRTVVGGVTDGRTMYFDGKGNIASVWWGDGSTPQFAIDSISGGGANFWTHTSGAWTNRARFTNDGYFRMTSTSSGIQFGGETAAAHALDDYEEGTWTPTLPNGGTLTIQSARFVKIGQQVTVICYVTAVAPTNDASQFNIGGLPFANAGYTNFYSGGSFGYTGDSNLNGWLPITGSNFTYIYFHVNTGATAQRTNAQYLTAASGSTDAIILTITYLAAT